MKKDKNYYLLEIVRPYKYIYLLIALLTFLNGFLASFNIVAIFPLLNSIIPGSMEQKKLLLFQAQNLVNAIPIRDPIVASSIFLFLVTIFTLGSSLFLEYLIGHGSSTIGYTLKDRLFKKYADMDYQFFSEHKHGEIFYYLFSAPQSSMTLFTILPQLAGEFIHILFLLGILFVINLKFTAFIIVFIILFNILITIIAKNISYNIGKKRKEFSLRQQVITNEFINGIKHIILYLAKPKWVSYFDAVNKKLRKTYLKEVTWLSLPKNILELSMYLFVIIMALLAVKSIVFIKNLPSIAIYLAACVRLLPHLTNVGRMRMNVMRLLPDLEALHNIYSLPNKEVKGGTQIFSSLRDSIVFKNIYFSYKNRPPLLKGLDFTIEAMKATAIVGASGSGKTTTINLLLKLLQPEEGEILIDGINLQDYITEDWLKNIGFVSQDPFIFHSSIKENISFGESKYPMEEIIRAAKIAYADEFIEKLPDKYETIVGEKGMKLSTGQQQRIAIARAIIRDPCILIFDEATNALDNISEEMIQKAIREITNTKTVIIIAHRLSTVKNADKIIVIKDGVKVEEGSHDRLIQARGYYQDIYYAHL